MTRSNDARQRCLEAYEQAKSNLRWVATYQGKDGLHYLCQAAQGRYTYATEAECQAWIDAALNVNSRDTLVSLFGDLTKIKARAVPCWPGHNDPTATVFGD